jgi:radical SAM/Cys-rich protein
MPDMELTATPAAQPSPPLNRFQEALQRHGLCDLERGVTTVLQINVGKLCNQACTHCHVEAGPKRTEIMGDAVVERLLALAASPQVRTVDLTGGAPEMNPHFRRLVAGVAALGKEVIARCNLTILTEPGYEHLVDFYAAQRVHLVCSLPCYTAANVNKQRGNGVFDRSIAALQRLNTAGYGDEATGLVLDLVFNPLGPYLPGSQAGLEADYKRELGRHFGVRFNSLLTLANLPIGRFARSLQRRGELEPYLRLLEESFNPGTVPHLMCLNTLNVGWDGQLYDCDFNQMLELPLGHGRPSLFDPDFRLDALPYVPVRTGEHCLGCTAGSGSSCGGALT